MFEKFSRRARLVLSRARQEAFRLDAMAIGTEHLLLGLVGQDDGIAAEAFKYQGINLEDLKRRVEGLPINRWKGEKTDRPFSSNQSVMGSTDQLRRVLSLASEMDAGQGVNSGHLLIAWAQGERLAGNPLNLNLDAILSKANELGMDPD